MFVTRLDRRGLPVWPTRTLPLPHSRIRRFAFQAAGSSPCASRAGAFRKHPHPYRGIRTGERPAPPGYTAGDFAIPSRDAFLTRCSSVALESEIQGEDQPALRAADELARTPLPLGMRILQLPPRYGGVEVITPQRVKATTAAGHEIWVWPNDRSLENLQACASFLETGVRGLTINYPGTAAQAVGQSVRRG